MAEVPYGSDKLSNSSIHHRGTHACDLLNAFLSGEHTLGRNLMAQVRYLLLEEVAFGQLELQPVVSEAIKYSLELCKVILRHFGVQDHVVQIHHGEREVELT